MRNLKKLFVMSDLHGHYTLAKEALDRAGFDEHNENHLFICCGDLFDRGRENRKVYDFVRGLEHKVLIRGNHDERLSDILIQGKANEYDVHNGTQVTFEEFFGVGSMGELGEIRIPSDDPLARELCLFVHGMRNYFETEHYVFVHGWLPTQQGVYPPQLVDNWREAGSADWRSARFSEWMSYFKSPATLTDKTVICGHRPTRLASRVDPARSPEDASAYYAPNMIALDAGTIRSGRVNLLVLEDHLLEEV